MARFIGSATLICLVLLGMSTAAGAQDAQFTADLSGANEVGEPGDSEGSGTANVDITGNEVCYQLDYSGSEDAAAAHIHQGAADANGDVVVDFDLATNGAAGCVEADADVVSAITADPAGYYVNVHTESFAPGAARGQLAAAGGATEEAAEEEAPATEELANTGITDLSLVLAAVGVALIAGGAMVQLHPVRRRTR